ncbi:MAG: MarC family protein [Candidatus Latescibacteria bacterium]|nr:MarC family protein [Candidatus Latescibacterota bacterium]
MDLYGFALLSLSSLFAVIDPLGCIPFFSGQTAGLSRARKRRILVKALLVSLLVLLLFTYAGSAVLHTFGITVDAFRIAGGIIFFGVGLDMLQSRPRRWHTGLEQAAAAGEGAATPVDPDHDPSVTPLAIPMIAGPASITTVMVLRAETPGMTGALIVSAAAALILLLTGVILLTADTVLRRLGPTGMRIVEKLMGLLVTVIAVQLVLNGAAPFLRDLMTAAAVR